MSRSAVPVLRGYQERLVCLLRKRLRDKRVLFTIRNVRGTTATPWRSDDALLVLDEPHHRKG